MNYYNKYKKYKAQYLQLKQFGGAQYYYHGSSNEIDGDYIEPKLSKVIDDEEAVFATNEKYVALVFIPKWSDCDLEFGHYGDVPHMMEIYPGAFDKLKNVSGYMYYLDPTNFESDSRLGMKKHEFISKQKEKIIKKEFVEDVWKELEKSEIKLITFDMKMDAIWEKYLK